VSEANSSKQKCLNVYLLRGIFRTFPLHGLQTNRKVIKINNVCSHLLNGIVLQVDSEQVGILAQLLHLNTKIKRRCTKKTHGHGHVSHGNLSIRTPDEKSTLKASR
jgi:hypothetical protein